VKRNKNKKHRKGGCCKFDFGRGEGAVAIAGGREELFRKKFLSPPCTPPHSSKTFRKMGFATDIL